MDDVMCQVILAKARDYAAQVSLDSIGRPRVEGVARQVGSWQEAAEESEKWGDWVDIFVVLSNQVSGAYSDRFQEWYHIGYDELVQEVAAVVRPAYDRLVGEIPPLFEREHIERLYVNTGVIQAMEAPLLGEDVLPAATRWAAVLMQGHFLCGFDELEDAMRMVIY